MRTVRRRFPASFEVALEVRCPVAVLCVGPERLALDREGVVVQRDSELRPPLVPEIRTPRGAHRTRPRVGRAVWQDSVLEALAVVRELASHRAHVAVESLQPVEVSVGDADRPRKVGAGDIRVRLANGVWLRWGRSPISPLAALELPVDQKLDHLAAVIRRFPGLVGIREVDLRFDDPRVVPAEMPARDLAAVVGCGERHSVAEPPRRGGAGEVPSLGESWPARTRHARERFGSLSGSPYSCGALRGAAPPRLWMSTDCRCARCVRCRRGPPALQSNRFVSQPGGSTYGRVLQVLASHQSKERRCREASAAQREGHSGCSRLAGVRRRPDRRCSPGRG